MPNGDTDLRVGDEVTVLTEENQVDAVQELFGRRRRTADHPRTLRSRG